MVARAARRSTRSPIRILRGKLPFPAAPHLIVGTALGESEDRVSTVPTPAAKLGDRPRLHLWAAAIAAFVVFAGFAPTFYLKGLFGAPALSPLLLVHGVVMTLWFVLFIVQAKLVAAGRADLHRRLGVFGAMLFALIVVVALTTAIDAGRRGATPAPGVPALVFMAIPLGDIVVFGSLVGTALWLRRRSDIHKRLMLLATLSILTPAIARLPLDFIRQAGLPLFFGLTVLAVIVCVAADSAKNRRLHPAFGWGGALVIASLPLRVMIAGTPAWTRFATWLVA
jgi:hypothetical protein